MGGDVLKLYKTIDGPVLAALGNFYRVLDAEWDELFNDPVLPDTLRSGLSSWPTCRAPSRDQLCPPIGSQEVWAAGVTYQRSRKARMEEAQVAGGGDFYDRVYEADRPELFLKATPHRVSGHGQPLRIRSDSKWNVPEPELALAVNSRGQVFGYTIGNDMSSRDIEGENPLYLPQAKVYDQCCGLGPCVLVGEISMTSTPAGSTATRIRITITRQGVTEFYGETSLDQMRRSPRELVDYLFRDNSFPNGCFLLTGTGIVPPDDFTLRAGDQIRIGIEPIGVLENVVVRS